MKNRVQRLEYVRASEILPNPKNFQDHPEQQRTLFQAVADDVGMVDALKVFQTANGYMLVDGHMRRDVAGDEMVPVLVLDLDEHEADKILATFDPIKRMALEDQQKKQALYDAIRERETVRSAFVEQLDAATREPVISFEDWMGLVESDEPEEMPANHDFVFPSDNEWGIPMLDAGLQAEMLTLPAMLWGAGKRTQKVAGGTVLFYLDDYRFEALFRDPAPIVLSRALAIVEPNFSVYMDTPKAMALYQTYKKRWIARYCQHYGVRVWVDLYASHDAINLIGVPEGWRSYATRGNVNVENIEATYQKAIAHRGGDDVLFLVYGGGDKCELYCRERGWLWLPEYMDMRRKWKRSAGNG